MSRLGLTARRLNLLVLRARRLVAWTASPSGWARPEVGGPLAFPHELYRRRWPIAGVRPALLVGSAGDCSDRDGRDRAALDSLERGKIINVALAAPYLSGAVVAPDRPFSFWRAVPRPTAARGYRLGMELRGGCVVPSAGGGLCLLSNALFAAAAELGWRVVERHAHSMTVAGAGSDALDATVLWPHVDLRFAPRSGRARLEVRIRGGELEVLVHGDRPAGQRTEIHRLPATEREEAGAPGLVRTSAVRRVVRDAESGALVEDTFIALDRKRVVPPATRTCLTCDRDACRARPRGLAHPGRAAPAPR